MLPHFQQFGISAILRQNTAITSCHRRSIWCLFLCFLTQGELDQWTEGGCEEAQVVGSG